MQIGMIGLGRMGASMLTRLLRGKLDCGVHDRQPQGIVALAGFEGRVSDSGEGRWMIQAASDEAVPAPVLSAALYARFGSRVEADFAYRLRSAMRHEFGGHVEKPAAEADAKG